MEGDLGSPNASVLGERSLLVGSSWLAAFLCFIILLTTAGNFLLILLIVTQRSLRNTSNYFLVSLFMSDLMVGLVVMPPAMLNQLYGRWVLRGDFCSLWYAFDVMCCSASILNLCIISLDRYLLIISPLKYKLRMTSCRALWLILAAWTLAALASFLPIKMGWHKLEFEVRSPNITSRGDEDQCRLVVSLPYALVASCLTFFLPSAAISFTYCRILLAARKQAVQVASLTSNVATATTDEVTAQVPRASSQPPAGSESRRFASKHSKKALKASLTLGILLGMFFVAWLPFFITNVTQAVCECIPAGFFDVLTWLGPTPTPSTPGHRWTNTACRRRPPTLPRLSWPPASAWSIFLTRSPAKRSCSTGSSARRWPERPSGGLQMGEAQFQSPVSQAGLPRHDANPPRGQPQGVSLPAPSSSIPSSMKLASPWGCC
uniref:5-hydroxytryptamine receptor 6 n=1 Tax=Anser brachyrhynchus TaxID=132585 RepID=A0A8B9CTE0_9AVES